MLWCRLVAAANTVGVEAMAVAKSSARRLSVVANVQIAMDPRALCGLTAAGLETRSAAAVVSEVCSQLRTYLMLLHYVFQQSEERKITRAKRILEKVELCSYYIHSYRENCRKVYVHVEFSVAYVRSPCIVIVFCQ